MSSDVRMTEADRLKAVIDELGERVHGLVVTHGGHEMRLYTATDREGWEAFSEVMTPNGDMEYITLDAYGETITVCLDRLAASMTVAEDTGERPETDDDGNLIEVE